MDLNFMNNFIVPLVVGICLCVGYILKHVVKADVVNKYIPVIMGVLGVALNIWIHMNFTPEILLGGLFSGLASTGLHQAFKQVINSNTEE
jgi:hypothetical protein